MRLIFLTGPEMLIIVDTYMMVYIRHQTVNQQMTKYNDICLQTVLLSERKCLYALGLFTTPSICIKEIGRANVFKYDSQYTLLKVEILTSDLNLVIWRITINLKFSEYRWQLYSLTGKLPILFLPSAIYVFIVAVV